PAAPVASGAVWDVSFADGIAVDGRLDDWQRRGLEIPVACTDAGAGQTWPGATIGLAWNNTGLLVRADVVDTDIQESDAVSNLWSGDSIEMFLADRCGGPNSIQVVAGTGVDPRYKETRLLLYDRRSSAPSGRANAAVEATVAGASAPRGYRFEAMLPWSALGIRPRPGCEVGFQIYVNNAASNRAPMAARFYPQGGTFADTRLMHTLRLTDADDKQRIADAEPVPSKTQDPWRANTIRFAAVPVPCAGLLLTPVEDDSGLGAIGLDAASGAVVWRTRLAYGPAAPAPRAAPMNVTVDGTTAYLCPGNGSVICLDGCDGNVLWTTFYEPQLASFATNAANEATGRVEWMGDDDETGWAPGVNTAAPESNVEVMWEESLALVAGETVVALPEDSPELLAFNRRTGAPLWARRKPNDVTYVVGRQGARLIVAGARTVACVDLTNGREHWRTAIGGSTGRGALCGPEVLIPSGRTILRLRAEDGTKAGQMRAQTMNGWPLGNLYANGDRLLVAGPEQLYALIPSRPVFARLTERLAREPSAQTHAERGRLYAGIERYAEAVADLREAWKRSRGTAGEEAIRSPLLNALWSAAERDAGAAKAFYAEACAVATTTTERAESTWRLAQCLERTGDTNEALARYEDLLASADASIAPTLGDADWTVSTRRLAAQRIRALYGEDAAKGRALLDAPAAQALARLGPAAAWTALVEVATFFPDAEAGREASLKAAQLAADRGDWGIAETILQRSLALGARSNRVVIAGELARLYERMKWPQGLAQLRDEWPASDAGERAPEFLKLAATHAAALPLPPWRLRWRKTLDAGTGFLMVPAGAFYWNAQKKQIGCLTLETGQPRWQTNGAFSINQTALANEHLLTLYGADNSRAWVDVWSGVLMTNGVFQSSLAGRAAYNYPVLSRNGLVTTGVQGEGGLLTSMDVLTGQVIWRRTEMESLLGLGAVPYPNLNSAEGLVFVGKVSGQTAQVLTLDPWTGAIVTRRHLDQQAAWTRFNRNRGAKRWSPAALDVGSPVLEKQQLTAKNLRRGGTAWTSPPELAIIKYQVLNEMVLAQTEKEELVLLSGETGRVLQRSQGEPFAFNYATVIGDAAIAFRQMEGGTNEVLVLDPAITGIAFRGRLSPTMQPLMTLGPALPDHLLVNVNSNERVKDSYVYRSWIQVIDGKGNNPNGWRLPRNEEIRDKAATAQYAPYFTPNAILMVGQGEVLAYEHDPGDGAKKP
ncbi:MAG: PQQ-binding-like beta-propeller repeat protein, partial [bacterium]